MGERARSKDYFRWLKAEVTNTLDVDAREDVDELSIPKEKRANLPEHVLEQVEQDTGTFACFDGDAKDTARLLVCGYNKASRVAAVAKLRKLQDEKPKPKWDEQASWGDGDKKRKVVYI